MNYIHIYLKLFKLSFGSWWFLSFFFLKSTQEKPLRFWKISSMQLAYRLMLSWLPGPGWGASKEPVLAWGWPQAPAVFLTSELFWRTLRWTYSNVLYIPFARTLKKPLTCWQKFWETTFNANNYYKGLFMDTLSCGGNLCGPHFFICKMGGQQLSQQQSG